LDNFLCAKVSMGQDGVVISTVAESDTFVTININRVATIKNKVINSTVETNELRLRRRQRYLNMASVHADREVFMAP